MGVFKQGENWFIDFRYRGKRYQKKIGPQKRQAELALQKTKVAIAENKFFDVEKKSQVLFADMSQEYLDRYSKLNKKSTSRDITSLKHLKPFFGSKILSEINPLIIEDYKAQRLNEGCAKGTVNRELALFKHIYTKAIEWGKTKENPVKRVKLFRENNQRTRYLEKGELGSLIDACPEFLRSIVLLAVNTGMRQGEILSLTWQAVDLTKGIITLRETKNGEIRFVPLNSTAKGILLHLRAKCNPDSPYVFCDGKGRPLTRFGSVRGTFERAVEKAQIRDFRFHDLRHTFASHLVMSGADILTVKELLGHKTLAMTLRYSHLSPNFKRSTVELLCNRLETFWRPDGVSEPDEKLTPIKNILYNKQNLIAGRVAELADAQDLKS